MFSNLEFAQTFDCHTIVFETTRQTTRTGDNMASRLPVRQTMLESQKCYYVTRSRPGHSRADEPVPGVLGDYRSAT